MKQLMFSLLVAFSAAALAQAPAKEAAKPEPMKEEAKSEAKPDMARPEADKSSQTAAAPRKGPRRWNEDARHCLDKPTNTEIIKCAEEYL